jgi:alpha-tubulin suppressor-like RCC1 family protein
VERVRQGQYVLGQSKLFENQRAFFIYETAGEHTSSSQQAGSGPVGRRPSKPLEDGEYCDAEDLILSFYPPDVPTDVQLFLVGASSALFFFARGFDDDPQLMSSQDGSKRSPGADEEHRSVISLESTKMALRRVDTSITMVLTGFIEEADEDLLHHLEAAWAAFKFYHGGFLSVARLVGGSRERWLEQIRRDCLELVPLISLPSFLLAGPKAPLAYSDVPTEKEDTLDDAETLLEGLAGLGEEICYLGASVFYDNSVLVTDVGLPITRWLLNRVEFMRSATLSGGSGDRESVEELYLDLPPEIFDSTVDPPGPGEWGNHTVILHPKFDVTSFSPVFLQASDAALFRSLRRGASARPSCAGLELPEAMVTPTPQGEYVGLYVHKLHRIALAVLVELPSLYSAEVANTIRSSTMSSLYNLSTAIAESVAEGIEARAAALAAALISGAPVGATASLSSSSSTSLSAAALASSSSPALSLTSRFSNRPRAGSSLRPASRSASIDLPSLGSASSSSAAIAIKGRGRASAAAAGSLSSPTGSPVLPSAFPAAGPAALLDELPHSGGTSSRDLPAFPTLLHRCIPVVVCPPGSEDQETWTSGLYAWGWTGSVRLRRPRVVPEVKYLGTIQALSAGGKATLLLTEDGELFSWTKADEALEPLARQRDGVMAGLATCGVSGITREDVPLGVYRVSLPDEAGAVAFAAAGGSFCVAAGLKTGSLYSWGENDEFQLGQGSSGKKGTRQPTRIPGTRNIVLLACGGSHSLALRNTGELICWGSNSSGQLGVGDFDVHLSVKAIHRIRYANESRPDAKVYISSIACGLSHSALVTDLGHVYTFGNNEEGQLGLGDRENHPTPKRVKLDEWAVDVACGFYHTLILTADGGVYSCGWGHYGQLGLGPQAAGSRLSPAKVVFPEGSARITSISCGANHSCAVAEDGSLWVWGWGKYGQLGIATDSENRMEPTLLGSVKTGTPGRLPKVKCGWLSSLAVV